MDTLTDMHTYRGLLYCLGVEYCGARVIAQHEGVCFGRGQQRFDP